MASKKRLDDFLVYADIKINTCIEIKAESLDDAMNIAKSLNVYDFVNIHGDFNDGGMKIAGVIYTKSQEID